MFCCFKPPHLSDKPRINQTDIHVFKKKAVSGLSSSHQNGHLDTSGGTSCSAGMKLKRGLSDGLRR